MRSILFIILLIPSITFAADPWTKEQIRDELIFSTLTFADYHMTLEHVVNGNRIEDNPLLGPNPTQEDLAKYMAGTVALHAIVTHFLPSKYREKWQWFWIGLEGHVVIRNVWVIN